MERVDLVSVAILWSIGLLALIHAVNARGYFRIAMTWILSLAIFAVAFFFSSLKAIDIRNLFSAEGPVQGLMSAPPHSPPSLPEIRRLVPESERDSLGRNYRTQVERLLKDAQTCAESVQAFPAEPSLRQLSASQNEKLESRARALRNQSSNLHRQLHRLQVPPEWGRFHDDLLATLENLRLAGYEIHSQFSSDEDPSRQEQYAKALRHSQQAISGLADAEMRLKALP